MMFTPFIKIFLTLFHIILIKIKFYKDPYKNSYIYTLLYNITVYYL